MAVLKRLFSKLSILSELVTFFWRIKLWWLIPMIVVLVLFGMLLILTQSAAVAPFIYSLF